MRLHRLRREQRLPADIDEVWAFFSDPGNLEALTPPEMAFEILSPLEPEMTAGQILRYRIRLARGVRVGWVTEITHLERRRLFVDEQRAGPYRFWHHRHTFVQQEGGVRAIDEVHYALPLGPLGELVHALDVRARLDRIFDYREAALRRRFSVSAAAMTHR